MLSKSAQSDESSRDAEFDVIQFDLSYENRNRVSRREYEMKSAETNREECW